MKIYRYHKGEVHSVEAKEFDRYYFAATRIPAFGYGIRIPKDEASPTKRDEIDRAEAQALDKIAALTHQIEILNAEIKKIQSLR